MSNLLLAQTEEGRHLGVVTEHGIEGYNHLVASAIFRRRAREGFQHLFPNIHSNRAFG
jgi:hypothetical protein